jgi:hypothetical protein
VESPLFTHGSLAFLNDKGDLFTKSVMKLMKMKISLPIRHYSVPFIPKTCRILLFALLLHLHNKRVGQFKNIEDAATYWQLSNV